MDLTFLHEADLILWVTLFTGGGLFYYLAKILSEEKWYQLLLVGRIIIFLILGIMLFNPILNISGEKEKKLNWAIFV
ncbi:MAG: hypothetical protein U9N31_09720, partial [Candidatus Marinimicrobia bacterium]|nr:hypothetical protein [Candidatus Neomarinimicrobiota bacterium]